MKAVESTLHAWHHPDAKEAADEIRMAIGDLAGFEIFGSQVLVAPYVRPTKTAGGIIVTPKSVEEDIWQGKVALVLKVGPNAFDDTNKDQLRSFGGRFPEAGDWVFHRIQDAFQFSYEGPGAVKPEGRAAKGWQCRLIYANDIYGRIPRPQSVV